MTNSPQIHDGLRAVRRVLELVCVADVLLGLAILLFPGFLFQLFRVTPPQDLLWFQLIGMMLIPGAVHSFKGFRDFERGRWHAIVSAASRVATAAFLITTFAVRSAPVVLLVLAIGEAVVGALTVYYLRQWSRAMSRAVPID